MTYDVLHLGSTYDFESDADGVRTTDGELWDLTGATVTLIFRRPAGTYFERTATVVSVPLARVRYTSTTSDLDAEGNWQRAWRVVQGAVDVTLTPWVSFVVKNVKAAA